MVVTELRKEKKNNRYNERKHAETLKIRWSELKRKNERIVLANSTKQNIALIYSHLAQARSVGMQAKQAVCVFHVFSFLHRQNLHRTQRSKAMNLMQCSRFSQRYSFSFSDLDFYPILSSAAQQDLMLLNKIEAKVCMEKNWTRIKWASTNNPFQTPLKRRTMKEYAPGTELYEHTGKGTRSLALCLSLDKNQHIPWDIPLSHKHKHTSAWTRKERRWAEKNKTIRKWTGEENKKKKKEKKNTIRKCIKNVVAALW